MRVGVLSDVHANRVALEAVLADMPPVDALVCAVTSSATTRGRPTASTG